MGTTNDTNGNQQLFIRDSTSIQINCSHLSPTASPAWIKRPWCNYPYESKTACEQTGTFRSWAVAVSQNEQTHSISITVARLCVHNSMVDPELLQVFYPIRHVREPLRFSSGHLRIVFWREVQRRTDLEVEHILFLNSLLLLFESPSINAIRVPKTFYLS